MNNKRLLADLDYLLKADILRNHARVAITGIDKQLPAGTRIGVNDVAFLVAIGMLGVAYKLVGAFQDQKVAAQYIHDGITQAVKDIFKEAKEYDQQTQTEEPRPE
jgi:hypothetical protein